MTDVAAQAQTDDRALLDQYLKDKSHDAFGQIVRRYVDLVYATSLRRVRDRHLAEDVTQAVFIVLSQRASTISASTPLPAWLHRTACYASCNAIKMETRRNQHEQQAAAQKPAQSDDAWPEIEPMLDEALNRLSTIDRSAVLLRYYQDNSVEQTARALNLSLEATKKRLQRALQKLRGTLSRNGITLSSAALSTTLATNASTTGAAPLTLTTSTTAAAATAASASSPTITTISKGAIHMLIQDQLRTVAIWLVAALLVVGGVSALLPRFISRAVTHQITSTTSEPAPPTFAPVIELTVNDDGLRNNECIDFDKGVTVSGPQRGFANRAEGAKWFRESGADCHAEAESGAAGLYPVGMAVVPVERDEWENADAAQLARDMADAVPQRPLVSSEEELPVTFAFKTREGGIGIAQIIAMDRGVDEHGTIKVRFKLVK